MSYGAEVRHDSPVSYWPLDETSGSPRPSDPLVAVFATLGERIVILERDLDQTRPWSAQLDSQRAQLQGHNASLEAELGRQKPETERFRRIANDWRLLGTRGHRHGAAVRTT